MGNAGSAGGRDRQKGGDLHAPHSPTKEDQAFVFDKKREPNLVYQSSHEDEDPIYTKSDDTSSQQIVSFTRYLYSFSSLIIYTYKNVIWIFKKCKVDDNFIGNFEVMLLYLGI